MPAIRPGCSAANSSTGLLKSVGTRHFEERSDEKSFFLPALLKRDFSLRSK
jgi:hypothetical protein